MRLLKVRDILILGFLLLAVALYFIPSHWLPFGPGRESINPTPVSTKTNLGALRASMEVVTVTPTPEPSLTPRRHPTFTPSPSYFPTPTLVSIETPLAPNVEDWRIAGFRQNSEGPQPYLDEHRIITFYGNPHTHLMGILGAYPRNELIGLLRSKVAEYQRISPAHRVLPAFQIVSTVADGSPGPYGTYNNWLDTSILEDWIVAAKQAGVIVIIDIQPGQSDVWYEFERLKQYLYEPHVHLALDSEFTMPAGQVPGQVFGHISADDVNAVQEQLNEIAHVTNVNKVLIIHQFEESMVPDKEGILDFPHVELVIDADGYGRPEDKTHDYIEYAGQSAIEYSGIKLFFLQDTVLMTPSEIMALDPQPSIIIYQ